MIRDYLVLTGITASLLLVTLIASFTYYVSIESIITAFTTEGTSIYNMTISDDLDGEEITAEELQPFRTFLITLQYAGILSIMMSIISSTIIVAKVRYSPFGSIIMIVLYFVGIFMSMVFSNAYVYMHEVMTEMIPSFSVLTYLDWMALNLPYINAVVGGVMFFLAYSKTPFKQGQGQGFSFER